MITAENIREVRFSKVMGGYKTSEVDAFLDHCAETIEMLSGENDEADRKMQVLAETIVEYRNQEDSIRTALLSAQRMSETVLKEAEEKAAALISEAEEKATALVSEAEEKAENIGRESKESMKNELAELARIQKEVAAFRSRLLATYREHLTLIGVLSEEEKPELKAESIAESEEADEDVAVVDDKTEDTAEVLTGDVKIDISAFELKDED